mmetsp:Transcript_43703/g.71030  ORF Transcript_43703/g.71030 Transcript_43703/m.71030 type:complete len:225 (+) Transcript_43703:1221-1895(+)
MNTPCTQSEASWMSGTTLARRPPNRMAERGTPLGLFHPSLSNTGHCAAGAVNLELGWAAFSPLEGSKSLPFQSIVPSGAGWPMPSHQTSPSGVMAVLVKILFLSIECMAFLLLWYEVPGATPKKPASGLTAYNRPSAPYLIHAISSPTHSNFQPGNLGSNIARLVLPQAEGKAAATYFFSPCGFVTPRISMCSASQPSSRPMTLAIRKAKHFLPSNAFPPYPLP